jgi:hypothetical protein
MIAIAIIITAAQTAEAAKMKKMKEWCMGNGCVMGAWHECGKYEANVCRRWSDKKPE